MSVDVSAIISIISSLATPLSETVIPAVERIKVARIEIGDSKNPTEENLKPKSPLLDFNGKRISAGSIITTSDGIGKLNVQESQPSSVQKQVQPEPRRVTDTPKTRRRGSRALGPTMKVDASNIISTGQQVVISPVFKLVFLTVVALTVSSGMAATGLAFVGDGSHTNQQSMFESMNTAWKLGLGAVFGLLGGKAA